jgi:hypothetical protein
MLYDVVSLPSTNIRNERRHSITACDKRQHWLSHGAILCHEPQSQDLELSRIQLQVTGVRPRHLGGSVFNTVSAGRMHSQRPCAVSAMTRRLDAE